MSPQRIVIADNESIIRMDLRELLEEAGHQVVGEGANGKKAVELARKLKPDLIILDIKMPEMDGITAAKIIDDEKINCGCRCADGAYCCFCTDRV